MRLLTERELEHQRMEAYQLGLTTGLQLGRLQALLEDKLKGIADRVEAVEQKQGART